MYSRAIAPKKKGDEDKIASALNKLMDEDPTFIVSRNPVTKETLISGMGDQHLDILMERMKRKFGVDAVLKPPMVEYRGNHPGFCGSGRQIQKTDRRPRAVRPCGHQDGTPASGIRVRVRGQDLWRRRAPAVYPGSGKGMKESMEHGILAGYPVVDLKITLLDGSYHTVDSSEMAFKWHPTWRSRKRRNCPNRY